MSSPESSNPFPGLRSFEPDEDHLFFGREAQIDELLRRLRKERFLALVGTSGSGKSSLIRAGLIPALFGGAMSGGGSAWRVAIVRPGGNPLGNLAEALAAPDALGSTPGHPDRYFLEAVLRTSRLGLVESVCEARLPAGDRVLVLADQFEELIRFRQRNDQARDEALAFVRLLLEAVQNEAVPVYVALTLRAEYIGYCMEFPGLPEAINAGLYLVPRLTRDQLREAVTGPVAVGGGRIALRLVHRVLNDVGDDARRLNDVGDDLPILQHALMRTWDQWDGDHAGGEPLDLRHYEAVGTMAQALSLHTDEAYGELDSPGAGDRRDDVQGAYGTGRRRPGGAASGAPRRGLRLDR
jgi:energy-coupling factor transporter ATP-binding protein EcfA2